MSHAYNNWQSRAHTITHATPGVGTDASPVECPNCRHPMTRHSVDIGCHVGWGSSDCPEIHEGCECPISLALQHDPKREEEQP